MSMFARSLAPPPQAAPRQRFAYPGYGALRGAPGSPEDMLGMSAVYACIRKIATGVGVLPAKAYLRRLDGRDVAHGSNLDRLMAVAPNRMTPPVQFWTTVCAHLAGWGNSIIYKEFQGGRLVGLWPLHPSLVASELDEHGVPTYVVTSPTGAIFRLPAEVVIHIRVFSLDGVEGVSPITAARRELMSIKAEDHYREALIRNRAQPEGVLTTSAELSPNAADRILAQWAANRTGDNAGGVALLEGGMKWVPMSITPADAQWVENRQMNLATVARLFGLPTSEIEGSSGDSLTYATVEGNARRRIEAFMPYIAAIESALAFDRDLCPEGSLLYVKFDVDQALRAELSTRATAYSAALDPSKGWMNRDEVRALEDLPADPDWTPAPTATPTSLSLHPAQPDPPKNDTP